VVRSLGHCLNFQLKNFSIGAGNMGITGVKNESSLSCAMVNREAVRARQTVIAATRRQSWRAARQGGYSVKTVRELSVGGSCVTLGLLLRETASRISYRDRHGTRDSSAGVGRSTPKPAHHVLIIRRRNTGMGSHLGWLPLNLTRRDILPTLTATLTTIAFDDSSLQRFEART
jgi:hypothetical protein